MIKKLVEIEGMHCENCAKKVENVLYGLPEGGKCGSKPF